MEGRDRQGGLGGGKKSESVPSPPVPLKETKDLRSSTSHNMLCFVTLLAQIKMCPCCFQVVLWGSCVLPVPLAGRGPWLSMGGSLFTGPQHWATMAYGLV